MTKKLPEDFLQEAKTIALRNGGNCLSDSYHNCHTKLEFLCSDGHQFFATALSVKKGCWCPYCRYPTEALVRQFFECIFDAQFKQCSPNWLRGSEFGACRLDGLNESLKLAFEYHGSQHDTHVDFFHKQGRRRTLASQQARDAYVRAECVNNGVKLVEIPYLQAYTPDEFVAHLKSAIEAATSIKVAESSVEKFLELPFRPSKLKEMRELALSRGGECLSTKYVNAHSKLRWRCSEGHEWDARASNVKQKGYWCPVCSGWEAAHPYNPDPLVELSLIAESKGGSLISTTYVNNALPLEVKCAKGHTWLAQPWTLKRGHWCPFCTCKRLEDPLSELRSLAADKGGLCLGTSYKNNREKQPFVCAAGHRFELRPLNFKHHGMWCPTCLRLKKSDEAQRRSLELPKPDALAITDAQWDSIRCLIEQTVGFSDKKMKYSMREVLNAAMYKTKVGCAWSKLPKSFPPPQVVRFHFLKWMDKNVWHLILEHTHKSSTSSNTYVPA